MDRREVWTPPLRPEWLAHVNKEGSYIDLEGVVPLDPDSLVNTAIKNTGLSDFGGDEWREPFEIICRAFDEEAKLNLIGRMMCRSDMLIFLEGRLQIEEAYRQHPEIEDEEIKQPLIIAGQGRSGTSMLLNYLEVIPGNGAIQTWESMFPCPPPEKAMYQSDPRIEKADKLVKQWTRVVPELEAVHEFSGAIPTECVQPMCFSFTSIWFNLLGQIPSYSAYMERADWKSAYEYHKRLLKLLQWKNPRRNWVLKSPEHSRYLPTILEVFPDACLLWPHRDPVKAMSSSVNLTGLLNYIRSDDPKVSGFEHYNVPENSVSMLETTIDWLENGTIPKERLCNLLYVDLIERPVDVIRQIYEHFKMELSLNDITVFEEYLAANPREARPSHSYNTGTNEQVTKERALYSRYQSYFNIPNEI